MGQTSSSPSRNRRRSSNAHQGGSHGALSRAGTSSSHAQTNGQALPSSAHMHPNGLTPASSRTMPQPVQLHFNALLTPHGHGLTNQADYHHHSHAVATREGRGTTAAGATSAAAAVAAQGVANSAQSSPLGDTSSSPSPSLSPTAPYPRRPTSSLSAPSSSLPPPLSSPSVPAIPHSSHRESHPHHHHHTNPCNQRHQNTMTSAGQPGANHNGNHASSQNHPPGSESRIAEASSSAAAPTSSRVLRSTTERRRRTNLFSAFYPLLSRNSSNAASPGSSSSSGSSSPSSATGAPSLSNRTNRGHQSRGVANNANNAVSNNEHTLRHAAQTTTSSSVSASPSLSTNNNNNNTRTPRGLSRVRQRMHDEVSVLSTRSSSSRASSVRGVASASAPVGGLPSPQDLVEDSQMTMDLDSIGQRSHPSFSSSSPYHPPHPHHPSTAAAGAAAATTTRSHPGLAGSSGVDHMLTMEAAGMSSNNTLRPTTRYRTRAALAAISPAPISTSGFGSSISTTGATGVPEPSSASTVSSMSDTGSAPAPFSRFSIGLPNPRGGTSISSSLLPIRPDSDDEEQDMSLDPLIDHQPMTIDDAETASSIAVSMADHHHHRPPSRRRDLNPPPELVAEFIQSQFSHHHPPHTTTSNSRPLSTASSASSSMLAAAPTTAPGVSSSGSSISSEPRSTIDPYPMTRSRSAQLAAAARANNPFNPSGSSTLTNGGQSSGYQHLQYSSHMNSYGESSSTSYSGRRPTLESTESGSSTATLRRRAPGTTGQEQTGFRPAGFLAIIETGASSSNSNNSSRMGARETAQNQVDGEPSSPTSSSTTASSSSSSTATTSTTADTTRASRERVRHLHNQLPLLSRFFAQLTGARTTIRPSGSAGSGGETDTAASASATASASADSVATLAGPSESSGTETVTGDAQATSNNNNGAAAPRPRPHHHGLRVIQLASTIGRRSDTGSSDENGEGGANTQDEPGETIIVVLNAFGPLPRQRGQEGSSAAGTTTPEDGQQDTTNGGSESNNARHRGQPQWLVVSLSSAYLGNLLAGASLNLDGEGGLNYDELWEFANLLGPARPMTTTQEAINQAGFHVGRFEGAIPGMRDFATLGDATKCLVCMCEYEEGEDLRALSCKHGFHQACIDKWLTTGANKCPICRSAAVVPSESSTVAAEE